MVRIRYTALDAGFTLVESAVTVSMAAIILSQAVPALVVTVDKSRLEGAGAQLRSDIQFARSQAALQNQTLRISFDATASAGGCYVIHTGNANQCSCSPNGRDTVCTGGATPLRMVWLDPAQHISLVSNVRSMAFDPAKGTITPTATLRLLTGSGAALHEVVNILGRVRSCTPNATLSGYPAC